MARDLKINHLDPKEIRALHVAIYNDLTAIAANLNTRTVDGIINPSVVSIGTTPENVATTAFQYQIDGVTYHKAAVAAGTALTDADTINTAGAAIGLVWGAWILQVDAAGTISTHGVGADQVYATEALAIAALPATEANKCRIGYFTVQSLDGTKWTGKTDSLTTGSEDCTTGNFYSDAAVATAISLETLNA